MMPLPTIARQARGLDAEHGPHCARTHRAHQLLESGPLDHPRSRTSQILVKDHDLLETQLTSVILQSILPTLTLPMMQHLARRGLTNVDNRSACQPFSGQLGVHASLLLSPRLCRRRRSATVPELGPVARPCRPGARSGSDPAVEG